MLSAVSAALILHACSGTDRDFSDGASAGAGGSAVGGGGVSSGAGGSQGGSETNLGGAAGNGGSSAGTSDGGEPPVAPCGGLVCANGGVCDGVGEDASCDCTGTGYQGETCEENVDECEAAPCANDTECIDSDGSYSCDCSAAREYTGRHCDLLRFEPLPATFRPYDISPDGGVVVGASNNTIAHKYVNGEAVFLGFMIADNSSIAYGASTDGEIVVGASGTNFLNGTCRPVIWEGANVTPLDVGAGYTSCRATGVSADGRVIAGTCSNNGYVVVRWLDGVFEALGKADGVEGCSDVVVSDDGSTIGGRCSIYPANRGFIWTEETGFKLLPTLSTATNCILSGLSADGSAATGHCISGNAGPGSGYLWTATNDTNALPKTEGVVNGFGVALSADGLRVLGADVGAALWEDPAAAAISLRDLLPSDTPALSDWTLGLPLSLSADGKTILGAGQLETTSRHYIARIDD